MYQQQGSFTNLTPDFINGLAKWLNENLSKEGVVLEVMAGTGLLSERLGTKLYKEYNRENKIIATDFNLWKNQTYTSEWEKLKSDKVKWRDSIQSIIDLKMGEKELEYLIMSWPPFDQLESAFYTIKALYDKFPKAQIIYIGTEGFYQNLKIGTELFHEHMEGIEIDSFNELVYGNYNSLHGDIPLLSRFDSKCKELNCECKEIVDYTQQEEEYFESLNNDSNSSDDEELK